MRPTRLTIRYRRRPPKASSRPASSRTRSAPGSWTSSSGYASGSDWATTPSRYGSNTDRDRYPVPEPTSPHRRRGTWSGSAVRDILTNPKYIGYMVWNRRATKSGGKVNPPESWVWSD